MALNEVVDNDMKSIMEDLLTRAVYAKTEMCKDEPMSDNPPLFLVAVESDETNPDHDECVNYQHENNLSKPYHIAMVPLIHKEDIYDAYEDVVKALPIRKFDFLVLCVEGYGRENMTKEQAESHDRGDLEKDYKENPFSEVREGLILTAVDWDGSAIWNTMALYRYDDHGVPMFDEPMATVTELAEDTESYGRMPDALLATVGYMHLATKTLAYKNILDQAPKRKKGE